MPVDDDYIPAATLIVGREACDGGAPEYLMVCRNRDMAFAGGAWVFPGGRIDPNDREDAPSEIAAATIAAVRETLEEVGMPVGIAPLPDPALARALQDGLLGGTSLTTLLDASALALDPEAIIPFARWAPKMKLARRFDTWFLLGRTDCSDWPLRLQAGEISEASWVTAATMLDRIRDGDAAAIFPTKRNLERLARFATLDEAVADARSQSLKCIVPWIEERDGTKHVCIPEGRGYPVTSEPLDGALRA